MAGQELERGQKEPTDGGKRKLELTDQNPQEIAAPLAAEAKRPKIAIIFSENKPPSSSVPLDSQSNQNPVENKKITIPEGKVGLVIGKGGETIKQIQLQSGAHVQIAKDHEADLHLTRDLDLTGTSEQISKAEELVNAVISKEAHAASSTVHGFNVNQSEGKQFTVEVKVPNDKVGLLIGKGGETIKCMQSKSGADVKVNPLHRHTGGPSTDRTVYINGTAEQIETAKKLVNDVLNRKWILEPPVSSGHAQSAYASADNRAWPEQPQELPQYGYAHSGHQPTDVSYYGQTLYQTGQMTGYGYYGQKPQMGSAPFCPSYGYSQQAPNYTNVTAQAEVQRPYGQPEGPVSSQSTEPGSAYPPFWSGERADPPPSWQTESGYDPAVHWWEQTPQVPPLSTQATGEQAESQQPSKNGQSRSPATRPETRDENP